MLPLRAGVVVVLVLVLLLLLVVVLVVVMVVRVLRLRLLRLPLHLLNLMVHDRWGWLTLLGPCFRLGWSLGPTCC